LKSEWDILLVEAIGQMRIIIGLGNPGDEYKGTRHNVGFECIDKLAYDFNISMKKSRRFRAETGEGMAGGKKIMLVKPQTYMNLSGECVLAVLQYYKLEAQDILVVYDDYALPVGEIRVRPVGGANGQKGMANIIARLDTQEITRVRIGIGKPPPSFKLADYVLSRFLKEEHPAMIEGITRAGDAVEHILRHGAEDAMNAFNRKVALE
jgi:PTH1 family peptidyl-tRNA hydrolase